MERKFKWHYAFFMLIVTGIMVGFSRGGLMQSGGLFLSPIAQDLNVGVGTLSLYFSISAVTMMVALPFVGKMVGKYNMKMLIIVSVILQGGAFAAFGFLTQVWQFYAVSMVMAVGTAIPCHIIGPVLINSWFKKNTGLAMGIMMSINGLIAALIQPQIGLSISKLGWRATEIGVGIICMAVVIGLVLLFVKMPSGKAGRQPFGAGAAHEDNEFEKLEGISASNAKKSVSLFALFGFMFLLTTIASFAQVIAPFALTKGYDIAFGGSAMGMLMVGSLFGGLFFGLLSDKIGAQLSVLIAMAFGLVAIVMLVIAATSTAVFMTAMVLLGFMNAALGTMGPLLVTAIFGKKHYAPIYSIIAMGLAIGGMVGTPLFGFIFDKTGSFTLVLYLLIAMVVACTMLILSAFKAKAALWEREKTMATLETE